MLYLYGRGPGTGHVAEKIACGYFLLLRNKKQLILMAPFLAAVAATETHGRKNSLWLFFIDYIDENRLKTSYECLYT